MTRRTRRHHLPTKVFLVFFLVLLIAAFYILSALLVTWRMNGDSKPVNQSAKVLPCAVPDASYCLLVRRLVPAVEASDFSQLIANQVATPIKCPDPLAATYCRNTPTGTQFSLFAVDYSGQNQLMMRNDYIAFLRSYVSQAGPLVHVAPEAATENQLDFRDKQGAVRLELQLQQTPTGSWQFAQPITTE
jgi:hypothetical protein